MNLEVDISLALGAFTLSAGFNVMGKRIGVFGPSGSGKSTLMLALSGLVKPDSGRIVLDGRTLFDSGKKIHVPP